MTRLYAAALALLLAWLPAAGFAQTISSFSPSSGNVGTLVTLTGTGLNLVTAVAVNGTPGVLLSQTSTSLRLLVMPGTAAGPIAITGGAPAVSAAAFTVTRTALNPAQQAPKLLGTGAAGTASQGNSVALSADGNTLAFGGIFDDNQAGATWVFTRSGTGWTQQGPKLIGTGAVGAVICQGFSVALSADGNTLAVGGFNDNNRAGATWVFARNGTAWTQQGPKLVGNGAGSSSTLQGSGVALSADGNTLAVGGFRDSYDTGATWVFTRSGTGWTQQGPKLIGTGAVGAQLYQGQSVALSADGSTLAVGGVNDNNRAGATWVFTRSSTTWSQQGAKLVGTGAVGSFSQQGQSVALSADGNTLAVGGDLDDNYIGSTWVFTRSNTVWNQSGPKLRGTNATGASNQGRAVALSADGTTLAVGGLYDNNSAGATWVFSTASAPLAQRAATAPQASATFFPNPVTERFTVTGGARAGSLRLFDGTGRTLLTCPYHDGQPLDLSALPTGAYWLQLDHDAPRLLLKR